MLTEKVSNMSIIIDTTLREGEQTPGVHFSLQQKCHIIDGLVKIGIGEIEVGIASSLIDCPGRLLEYCHGKHDHLICSLWSRCREEDIHLSAILQPDIISLSLPVSNILIEEKMGKDREWIALRLSSSIALAKQLGLIVAVGFEDATRADMKFLLQMAKLAAGSGAIRIRLADTVGTATPTEIAKLVRTISQTATTCAVTIHCHNDFGMATANAVSALEHGAAGADATILGLGERCGCTRLEELAGFLRLKKNVPFNLAEIPPLSRYTANLTGRPIPDNQPFLGSKIFTCETGLHLHGLQQNPQTYEPYPPEMIGRKRHLLLGPKAGRRAIVDHLRSQGFDVAADINDSTARKLRRCLADGGTKEKTWSPPCSLSELMR